MIMPEFDHQARLDAFGRLLRDGAVGVRAGLVKTRSAWIEYESSEPLNINLDGEPTLSKQFRVECRHDALPVRLGVTPLLSGTGAKTS
jgi:diacylglycerol kinase family enzyme